MENNEMTVGKTLRKLRSLHKVSRPALAEATGTHWLTIKNIEIGKTDPKWSTICTLFRFFDIQPYFALHTDPISRINKDK
jgi:DNA-binding XRE family transcriptional regulator